MKRIILKIITYWCFVLFKNFENINVMRLASNENTLYILLLLVLSFASCVRCVTLQEQGVR